MTSVNSYKCPNCGANIPFDANSGKLKCQHCDTTFDIENLEAFNVEQDLKADVCDWNVSEEKNVDVYGKVSYVCPACGGVVIGDENMVAKNCPYCGTSIVVGEKVSGMLEPDMIIPFKLDKQKAIDTYNNFLGKKPLLPNDFKAKNLIEKISGIYVPYWLFDADVEGQARYKATRTRMHREGDYEVMETSHFLVFRDGQARFEKVPVDASSKLDDALLDSIEPFNYADVVPFKSAYLSNYLADKYDRDNNESIQKANERIKNSFMQILGLSVKGYDSVMCEGGSIQYENGKANYALLPVYVISTKYNGKVYQFAMNGQTGKFVGDLPIDGSKVFKNAIITFAIAFVIAFALMFFMLGGLN